jgi:hypothetical protein
MSKQAILVLSRLAPTSQSTTATKRYEQLSFQKRPPRRALFLGRCESIPRTGGWATRPRQRLTSQRGRVALTTRGAFFESVRVDSQNRRVGGPPTAPTHLTTRASRPHSEGAFFGSSVSRCPETGGWATRPRHRLSSQRGRVALTPRALFLGRV